MAMRSSQYAYTALTWATGFMMGALFTSLPTLLPLSPSGRILREMTANERQCERDLRDCNKLWSTAQRERTVPRRPAEKEAPCTIRSVNVTSAPNPTLRFIQARQKKNPVERRRPSYDNVVHSLYPAVQKRASRGGDTKATPFSLFRNPRQLTFIGDCIYSNVHNSTAEMLINISNARFMVEVGAYAGTSSKLWARLLREQNRREGLSESDRQRCLWSTRGSVTSEAGPSGGSTARRVAARSRSRSSASAAVPKMRALAAVTQRRRPRRLLHAAVETRCATMAVQAAHALVLRVVLRPLAARASPLVTRRRGERLHATRRERHR